MSEIIKLSKDIELTSKQIAEVTNKQHKHVITDVETLIKFYVEKYSAEKSAQWIKQGEYKDRSGKSNKMYILNRDAITDLITGYSLEHRHNVNQLMYTQEEEIKRLKFEKQLVLPQTYLEALEHLTAQVKENIILQKKIEQDAPKLRVYEAIAEADSGIRITEFARTISNKHSIGRNKLYSTLRDWKLLDRSNIPYQRCVEAGWFYVVERPWKNEEMSGINFQVFITGKGTEIYHQQINK